MNKPQIVFMGSGPVAAKSLGLLLSDFDVIAVITKPQPPHHKTIFPVLALADEKRLPTFTVSNKKELSQLLDKEKFDVELAILIDFGILVGQDAIDYFPKGIINSHFSLLPEWRGADPITFAILSGQKLTGVSLMLLVEAMDEGPIFSFGLQEINESMTGPELTDKLIYLSDSLLKNTIPTILSDTPELIKQEDINKQMPTYPSKPSYSRKLTKSDGILDFTKSANQLEQEVRAFIEWPKSRTQLAGIDVIITACEVASYSGTPGDFKIIDKKLIIYCGEKSLSILKIKPSGKPEMKILSFISGYKQKLTQP